MKRTVSLLLICLIPACFMAACKDPYPSAPTTVTGRIVDESGKPIKGVGFSLSGMKQKGVSGVPTFYITSESNANGEYSVSHLIPNSTDLVVISPGTLVDSVRYRIYIDYGDHYDIFGSGTIQRKDYGKTTILNFQFRKL